MNTKRLCTALCFALICSGLLTWQLSLHLSHAASAPTPTQVRGVVVAAKSIAAGEALTTSSVSVVNIPASSPLVGLFSKPEALVGHVLSVPVSPGEPITAHDLVRPEEKSNLSAEIPDGMRVISIPMIDPSEKSLGLITPGSRVDVLVSYRAGADATFASCTVLQNALVVDTGTDASKATGARPTVGDAVELLVSPEDAARVSVASSLGRLTFALRNGTDRAVSPGLSRVTLTQFANDAPKSISAPAPAKSPSSVRTPKVFTVETLSGGKSSFQAFPESQQ